MFYTNIMVGMLLFYTSTDMAKVHLYTLTAHLVLAKSLLEKTNKMHQNMVLWLQDFTNSFPKVSATDNHHYIRCLDNLMIKTVHSTQKNFPSWSNKISCALLQHVITHGLWKNFPNGFPKEIENLINIQGKKTLVVLLSKIIIRMKSKKSGQIFHCIWHYCQFRLRDC